MTRDNRRLYERLVRDYSGELYRFAYRLCGNHDAADDLVQETFCEAWRSVRALRDPTAARAWLMQICRHRAAHAVRHRTRRVRTHNGASSLDLVTDDGESDIVTRLADQEILQSALDALTPNFKEPFLLVFAAGLSCQEAADLLDLPLGTVLSRIHRARKLLRGLVRSLEASAAEDAEPVKRGVR